LIISNLGVVTVRLLREELQLLQESGSYVGEVVKAMDKKKVLVKVGFFWCSWTKTWHFRSPHKGLEIPPYSEQLIASTHFGAITRDFFTVQHTLW